MKFNIREVTKGCWTWDEVCDTCGEVIKSHNMCFHNYPPNVNESDRCIKCRKNLLVEKGD